MSFIITMYVREGIVMASDSRLTLNIEQRRGESQVIQFAVSQSDSSYKTFLAPNNVGISTYGAADINRVPIAGYIESFINDQLAGREINVDAVAGELLGYFRRFNPPPDTKFHVAGYNDEKGHRSAAIYEVFIQDNQMVRINPADSQGATWGGEGDILARLIKPVGVLNAHGELEKSLPHFDLPWEFFTLQDAIDFCIFAVRSTIDAIRFQPRPKSVGGPIDVLVIKPDGAFWIQRKKLHGIES